MGIGVLAAFGVTFLGPLEGYYKLGFLILSIPITMAIGAIAGNAIPADDLELHPQDPETLYFLEDHQWYRDLEDMPPILREKASR